VIRFDQNDFPELSSITSREWLITNGLGGYGSGTVAGMNTRRYHGLLVVPTASAKRIVLLSQLEDVLVVDGVRFALSTNRYQENVVHPSGYLNLIEFRLDPHPIFTYGNGDWEISREIFMIAGENTTIARYTLGAMSVRKNVFLEVRPLIAFRDYHATTHENEAINRDIQQGNGILTLQPYAGLPKLYFAHDPAEVQVDGYWYRSFEYERERERGLDYHEDLFSPLVLTANIGADERFTLIASTSPQSTSGLESQQNSGGASKSSSRGLPEFGRADLVALLKQAADQFVTTRTKITSTLPSIIAGYHWFGEWGRDTMIAMPGLLLATERPELAKEILLQYVQYIDQGMLPNRFPDASDQPEYNTVDATLWFFEAIRQYVSYQKSAQWRSDAATLLQDQLYDPLKEIVRHHLEGTRYGIHADEDGFLWAGDASTQLTWMDAKDGDVTFTPRHGRAVEIQALWYNALRTLASFGLLLGDHQSADEYNSIADRLRKNFLGVFWNAQRGCLFDVARGDETDAALRPNQIFAVSLRHPLISGDTASQVVKVVEDSLLTPFGLRTLSPDNPQYKAHYEGDPWHRDSAYHQGTVWPWLAGPFFCAKLAVSDSPAATLREIDTWLNGFSSHLRDAGVGQISEIFDGDPPFSPRGCIAQAWSVAEILRLAKRVEKS
jgi:predicted glycogen debranching enzyme